MSAASISFSDSLFSSFVWLEDSDGWLEEADDCLEDVELKE